jgi:hypothetical protein
MKRILLAIAGMFLVFIFTGYVWAEEAPGERDMRKAALMQPDRETLREWMNNYLNAPNAEIDEKIKLTLGKYLDGSLELYSVRPDR